MATWDGHLLGSLFLVIQGLWWISLSIWYHLKSNGTSSNKKRHGIKAVHCESGIPITAIKTGCLKSWIPQPFLTSVPIEPIAKIITCSIGIFGETFLTLLVEENGQPRRLRFGAFSIFNESGDFIRVDKFQHVTMYSGFVLSGIIDVLILFLYFPKLTSPLFFTSAYVCQGILFSFHMGHSVLNANYHKLHLAIIVSCIAFAYLRTHHMKNFLVNVALGCSILLQGTWFFQSAFFIYKDGEIFWELHKEELYSEKLEHMVPMYLSGVFTWHLIVIVMTVMIVWTILYFVVNGRCIAMSKGNNKWEAVQSECAENLIEDELLAQNEGKSSRLSPEIDTEV